MGFESIDRCFLMDDRAAWSLSTRRGRHPGGVPIVAADGRRVKAPVRSA
jgi:hypothetical protein